MTLTQTNQTRLERIAKMRMSINPLTGRYNTLEDIGRVEGVTRERIRQLLVFRPDVPKKLNHRRVYEFNCKGCGIKFKSLIPTKTYHSMSCYLLDHQLRKDKAIKDYTKEEKSALAHARYSARPEYWRDYAKRPYVAAKRKIYSKSPGAAVAQKRWYNKNKLKLNEQARVKRKNDPLFRAKNNAYQRQQDLAQRIRKEFNKR